MHSGWLKTGLPLLLILAMTQALAAERGKSGPTYKWVDDKGVTHYGDVVPPEYARQSRSELNSQGVTVREFPAQMSEAEAAEAQKSAAEQARRRQHDQFLLTTYTRATDIEQLRDERLALIDGQMRLAQGSIESVDGRLQALEGRMRGFKPYSTNAGARRLPDQLAEEVVRTLHEKRSLEESLAAREAEKKELRERFDADLARYRELTASRQPR
ncbi:MAG: DUF4124 domain-containing protein [Steroidobacteraceae bacterium]